MVRQSARLWRSGWDLPCGHKLRIPSDSKRKTPQRRLSFAGAAGGIRTHVDCSKLISSQPRYDHFDTAAWMHFSACLSYHTFRRCATQKTKFFLQPTIFFLTGIYTCVIITKLTISTEGACGCSTMARAPAFQAGDAGSIPVTRSIVSLMRQ